MEGVGFRRRVAMCKTLTQKMGLKEKSMDDIVDGTNNLLRFPILLGSLGTREMIYNVVLIKKQRVVELVIVKSSM